MNIDTIAIVSALVGLFFGTIIGTAIGIKDEAKKKNKHYARLINSAMENAYNAGYTDASTKGQRRPSGNK